MEKELSADSRPNIIYIHCHDAGRYTQPYGYPAKTPNIQRLAEEGILFRRAFSAAPTCSPSRAALLTGQCAHSCGMYGLAHKQFGGFELDDYDKHLARFLGRNGYKTVLAGFQHEAPDVSKIGYGKILPTRRKMGREVGAAAADFIRNSPEEPFFLSAGSIEPHLLMDDNTADRFHFTPDGPKGDPRYVMPPPHLPDEPEIRRDMADYYEAIKEFDAAVGMVMSALHESGLEKNTLVICTTDHGIDLPEMKCTLKDAGLGVMLIMRGPAEFAGGMVVDQLVSHVDIYPTLCEILGIEPPDWVEGDSLTPTLLGKDIRDEIYGEINYHADWQPERCVRTNRWKYIRRYEGIPPHPAAYANLNRPIWHNVLPNCGSNLSRDFLLRYGFSERKRDTEELYDLIFDPVEMNNLAESSFHAEILADMRKRLQNWMKRTNDPLLTGIAPPPPDI